MAFFHLRDLPGSLESLWIWVKDLSKEGKTHLSSEKGETTVITPFDSSCEVNSLFCFSDDLRESSIKSPILFVALQSSCVPGCVYVCVCVCTHTGACCKQKMKKQGKTLPLHPYLHMISSFLFTDVRDSSQSPQLVHLCPWWLAYWAGSAALLLKFASVAYCSTHITKPRGVFRGRSD